MLATLKLLNSYFWKTIYGPILAFVFPAILLAILGNILRLEYVYPGLIALSMLFLGVIALPLAIMELKGTSLFKYIGSSPVNPLKFTAVVIGFYAFIAICTGFVIFFSTMAFFPTKAFPSKGFRHGVLGGIFTLKGSFSFYIGSFIHLIFVIVTGLIIATFSRTPQQALTIGLMVTLPSMFLSGMILSVDVIGESPVMNWVSRFIPFRYSTGNLVVAATPVDQLGSAIDYWLHVPADSKQPLLTEKNGVGNNMLDTLIWPFKSLTDSAVKIKIAQLYPQFAPAGALDTYLASLPGVVLDNNGKPKAAGYEAWNASIFGPEIFQSIPTKGDATLYNILQSKWSIMQVSSDNNIFNWAENWGVRKIPSVDTLTDFVTKFFNGVDSDGNLKAGNDIGGRVGTIGNMIGNHDFTWLEVFTHQSNVLYYQVDRVLNTLLPVSLSGLGLWYVFKNFNWVAK